MNIKLSDHFTYLKLLRFTLPSIVMMIFTSIYGVVDGIFVSNFVGKTPFAAINLVMPVLMLFGALGFMIGAGGSALVSRTLGEGDSKRANSLFSMLIYITASSGIILSAIGLIIIKPVCIFLGAEGQMLSDCITYASILLPATVCFMLQNTFQSFLIAAEKPNLGLSVTVAAGLTNIILDALFIAVFKWGLVGAAVATALSQFIGGVLPLIYFLTPNSSLLRLGKAKYDNRAFIKTCTNGSSELMTNLSMSLVNILYNFQLLRIAGETGIAAYGVIMYVNFIFIAAFLGYSFGAAPVISYHFGADNREELQGLRKKSLRIIGIACISLTILAELLSYPLSMIFASYDTELFEMTMRAFRLYSISFLVSGFNIFGSSFFTALNDGLVSAAISFSRTLLFQIVAITVLPIVLGIDGIWLSVVFAEALSLAVTVLFFAAMKKKYNY